jgi:hypothetical protein
MKTSKNIKVSELEQFIKHLEVNIKSEKNYDNNIIKGMKIALKLAKKHNKINKENEL